MPKRKPQHSSMARAPSALCFRFSADLVQAALAALIIGAVLCAPEQHTDLSASLLQGFPCIPDNDVPAGAILAFAEGLQNRTAELSSAQLSCLARLLAARNLTADFSRYPPDLLLFFDLSEVHNGTCEAFYAQASHGNLELLPRGSAQRSGLLHGALTCLRVRSTRLRPEQLSSLGALVCDMEPETITASDPSILENLKLCSALTGAQRDALNAVLLSGDTAYGHPSSWDLQTLQSLGPLVLALNQTTLSLVPEAAREAFGRSIAAAFGKQGRSQREKSLSLLKAFAAASDPSHPRMRRSADRCLSEPITASTITDPLLVINYDTSEQFDLCLSNEVLKENLKLLLEQPFPKAYLQVVKKKLDQIYPSGIPEEQLKLLGPLSRQYSAEEISQWPVTSSDTLSVLLDPSDGRWNTCQIQQLLSRFLSLGGILTGPLLQQIGGQLLCSLQEKQIQQIPPEAIRTAGQLNISSCSQTKKDQLYRKAQEAFADLVGTPKAYYCRIWPYLGGAPAKDLKDLAAAGIAVDMDINTFLGLNPKALQNLSVTDVKNLLGQNLPQLKAAENETSVMLWVKRQSQRELDCVLGIGLTGGLEEPSPTGTPTPPHPTTSAGITPIATVPTAIAISSHPPTNSSTSKAPTQTPAPGATSTARPALTSSPPPAPTLLTTIFAVVNSNATSPSSFPPPALTLGATTSTGVVTNPSTSTPLVSMNPPALGGTPHPSPVTGSTVTPSTHNVPSILVANSTSAPTGTELSIPPHKPNSTISTSSTTKTTAPACKTNGPTASPSFSSNTTSNDTTKTTPAGGPGSARPTPEGYINMKPESGSGSRLSSCLVYVLTTAVGSSLLQGLL
ncbi:mesothelin-like protein isoform X2 [Neopsephotus bourkii]|uniref:mesothelin-like protein isoform X2 n=1 Tax=Neopsephotus bourkii TaxID=309878 RepID=UPI002AA5B5F4|nr:mesothelin-like protein isoform X2 [Neopsephotus bourkii]